VNRVLILITLACLLAAGCRRPPRAPVHEIKFGQQYQGGRHRGQLWNGTEDWTWTSRVFSVLLDPPAEGRSAYLLFDFALPSEVMPPGRAATLVARVNGIEVFRESYSRSDRYSFSRPVPAQALRKRPAEVEFEVDQAVPDGQGRPLGLIAVSVGLLAQEDTPEYKARQMELARQAYRRLSERKRLPIPPAQELQMMKLFHELPVWDNQWFQNVRIIKNPLDLWIIEQIAFEVRPDFIVETGTWHGGSALFWAATLRGLGLENSRVLTVDISDFTQAVATRPLWRQYVEFFLGSSTDPKIVSAIRRRVAGRKVIVALDSDHAMQHVLNELRLYSPMVSRGSYLIVEDTHLDGAETHPEQGPGPLAAVLEFLREGGEREFEQDLSREGLGMTFNPGGWLRRK
jgi:cephalosporin hydroxylase